MFLSENDGAVNCALQGKRENTGYDLFLIISILDQDPQSLHRQSFN